MSDCDIAPRRIYGQYRDETKPKVQAWYDITRELACPIWSNIDAVNLSYDIDSATTYELDVIGRIVGVSRSYELDITLYPSQFDGGTAAQFGGSSVQFGSTSVTDDQDVSNEIYRMLIRAKIAKNNSDATIESILESVSYIVSTPIMSLNDNEDMSFTISFSQPLSTIERLVLDNFDIIPRPQGVLFDGYIEETAITEFGGSFNWGDSRAQFGYTFGV